MIRYNQSTYHIPVLLRETVDGLNVKVKGKYIDATLGGGEHTGEILKRGGAVLGIDVDEDAINYVQKKFKDNKDIFLEKANFKDIKRIAEKYEFDKADGILLDLGVSSHQLDTRERGFSFKYDATLDMRMDQDSEIRAVDVINNYSKEKLYEIFTKYAEEVDSRAISSAIVRSRALKPIITTLDLVRIIEGATAKKGEGRQKATLVFQALRIAVNNELDNLISGLTQSADILKTGGRLVVISFHSLEDRIVKLKYNKDKMKMITKKPIRPTFEEIKTNPRSKAAKLRIFEKI